ncbi:MAG: ABC transporter C-terminal domain-containing protein, partial [Herbinix sp.]|nr:ABC transporter C-terminal domain-containing protein [Herbinix sp.]
SLSDSESENKQSWQQQKEEQARNRKRKSDLKKTEDEIHLLELRNDEIDRLLTQEDVFTNVQKLIELNNEKKEIEARLEELMVLWELLAAEE